MKNKFVQMNISTYIRKKLKANIFYFQMEETLMKFLNTLNQNHRMQDALEVKITKSKKTFSFDKPLSLEDGEWILDLTTSEVKVSVLYISTENLKNGKIISYRGGRERLLVRSYHNW